MRKRSQRGLIMSLPLFLFTIVFVAGPLIYMVALSFATNNEGYGVTWKLTLENYARILEPVYLQTFTQSFQLAITSTVIIILIGYPFGYFMAKLSEKWKSKAMLLLMLPFWLNSLIRLYGWIIILQTKGMLNGVLMKLENSVQLSSDCDWYGLCTPAVYDPVGVLQCREAGLVFDRSFQGFGSDCFSDVSDSHSETDASRSFVGNYSHLHTVHGPVFHCRHFGWK